MQPFERAYRPKEQIDLIVADTMRMFSTHRAQLLGQLKLGENATADDAKAAIRAFIEDDERQCEIYRNDRYQVAVYRLDPPSEGWPKLIHLSIKQIVTVREYAQRNRSIERREPK